MENGKYFPDFPYVLSQLWGASGSPLVWANWWEESHALHLFNVLFFAMVGGGMEKRPC